LYTGEIKKEGRRMNTKARTAKDLYNVLEDIDCDECPLQTACDLLMLNDKNNINICVQLSCREGE
jgi:hypothetical protein